MGLDITAYKNLRRIDCTFDKHGNPLDADGEPLDEDDFVRFTVNDHFPGREGEIEDRHPYSFDDTLSGPSCGYGGHSVFREALAALAGYEPITDFSAVDPNFLPFVKQFPRQQNTTGEGRKYTSGPFHELLDFTDCDGVLGTAVCAKLARDFAALQAEADKQLDEEDREHYAKWRAALEFASEGGAVMFH